jgi:hypothetical protein
MNIVNINDKVKFTFNNENYHGVVIGKYKDGKSVDVSVYGEFLCRKVLIKDLNINDSITPDKELRFTEEMKNLRGLWRR